MYFLSEPLAPATRVFLLFLQGGFLNIARYGICFLFLSGALCASENSLGKPVDPALKSPPIAMDVKTSDPQFVPIPMRGTLNGGTFRIDKTSRIVAATKELEPLARILANELERVTELRLQTVTGVTPGKKDILLAITKGLAFKDDPYLAKNPNLKGFEQRVTVSSSGIIVEGACYQAAAMASVTFLQAIKIKDQGAREKDVSLPLMLIEDKPGSEYCGTMLDVARQWHPIDVLYQLVDLCRLYKVMYLHFHFTDDQGWRLPSETFPQVCKGEKHYTMEQLKAFVTYADARGVTIVPEVEMPGHSSALQRSMLDVFGAKNEATGKMEGLGVLNIAHHDIYPTLEKLIGEYCAIFKSSPFFHMGGDECNFHAFMNNATAKKQLAELEAQGEKHFFSHFVNHINAIVKKNNKRLIIWEGFGKGDPVEKDVLVMAWHGSSHRPADLMDYGYDILNIPWTPAASWSERALYEWNVWLLNLSEGDLHSQQFEPTPKVKGGQMVYWEQGPSTTIPVLRTKMPPRQERIYSPYACRSFEDYWQRFQHVNALVEKLIYPVSIKMDGLINPYENLIDKDHPAAVTLTPSMKNVRVYYTLNKDPVTPENGTLYSQPFPVTVKNAGDVFISGYYGPRAELRVQAFDENNLPVGGTVYREIRAEEPRIAYSLYEKPDGSAFAEMPTATQGLKKVQEGTLARLESTRRLVRNFGNPVALETRSRLDVRTAGEWKAFIEGNNAQLRIDGKLIPYGRKDSLRGTVVSFSLDAGLHEVHTLQYANDGNIGMVFTVDKAPPDPAENARRFTNEYIHQWQPPLTTKQ
jgi:hexosaminidase